MTLPYVNANTALIRDLFDAVNDMIEQLNILLLGMGSNAQFLDNHPSSYYAKSGTIVTPSGLVGGGGSLANNFTISVSAASVANVARGISTTVAVTPYSLVQPRINLPAASTVDLGGANTTWINITGSASPIASFGSAPEGVIRRGKISVPVELVHSSSLIIPGSASYTTRTDDRYEAISLGSGVWQINWIAPGDGKAMIPPDWTDITSRPTTISGYGITDAASLSNTTQIMTGGTIVSPHSLATGNFTANPGLSPLQYITNNGAFTITAPVADGSMIVLVTNGATAGTVTFSGFSVGTNTGDTLTTTNTSKFMISIVRIHGVSTYQIKALQ
jgi:hypothetical protein